MSGQSPNTAENSWLGDLDPDDLRRALHRTADQIADYWTQGERYPVLPRVAPGELRRLWAAAPPDEPESLDRILDDYARTIEPNVTHWNHPGFFAYFAITGSGPGIIGEALSAALNVNAMLWRTGPAATELEEHVCDWLRQMLALPADFRGHINDTASISSFLALAAARQARRELDVRRRGLAGRGEVPALMVYCSEHAHSSIDKACIALGLGLDSLRRVPADGQYRLRVDALAAAIREDRAAGRLPIAVVATAGTTSTTSIDPIRAVAAVCQRERLWLHVDAAYAGSAAICPEIRAQMDGLELADSIVVNPHKWLFVPVDCSVLLLRDPELLREAFAVTPEYLRTPETQATNLMDYGLQLGRRFRSLKLWMVVRAFGVHGLQARIRQHCGLAREFAGWIEADPDFELLLPPPFSVVCFRARAAGASGPEEERWNEALLERINASGEAFLSHTKLGGRMVLRLAIGNLRTQPRHVRRVYELLRAWQDEKKAGTAR